MQYTLGGLVLASFFGMFFGSEGEMDALLFSYIFWGLIGSGALLNFLVILRDALCRSGKNQVESGREGFQRYLPC